MSIFDIKSLRKDNCGAPTFAHFKRVFRIIASRPLETFPLAHNPPLPSVLAPPIYVRLCDQAPSPAYKEARTQVKIVDLTARLSSEMHGPKSPHSSGLCGDFAAAVALRYTAWLYTIN